MSAAPGMDAWIYDTLRTPRGKGRKGGGLSTARPVDLVSHLLLAALTRTQGLEFALDDVLLGCVTQCGEQGANLAKIAALYAGLPHRVSGATLNRFCASGLEAVSMAAARVHTGMEDAVMAGGVESMSRVPIYSDQGAWFADKDVAKKTGFVQMGFAADLVATLEGFEREELDALAARSHQRAAKAMAAGYFKKSIVPFSHDEGVLQHDELVRAQTTQQGISEFDALFADEQSELVALKAYPDLGVMRHVHHRANSPSLADGAGLVLVGSERFGQELGKAPRARILSAASASVEPVVMLTASQSAASVALARAGLKMSDMDLVELNEAFAAPVLKFMRDLEVSPERLNVNGGTIAAGHAMGATGAILLGVLLDELERRGGRYGLVAISGGAGLGSAMVIECVQGSRRAHGL